MGWLFWCLIIVKVKLNGRVMRVEKILINGNVILVILMVNFWFKGFIMVWCWLMVISISVVDDVVMKRYVNIGIVLYNILLKG